MIVDKSGSALSRILVVDDEHDAGDFIAAAAQALGMCCSVTTSTREFMSELGPEVGLVMMDLMMPDIDGIELLRWLGRRGCMASIVLMSGCDESVLETAEDLARELGLSVAGHLQKPFRLSALESMLRTVAPAVPHVPKVSRPSIAAKPTAVLEADLREAILRTEFVVHYQPQIEIGSDLVVGLEALVRWQHPLRGLVFPDAFIEVAESFGLIDDLGWLVATEALRHVGRLKGNQDTRLTLSLNVSTHSLHDLSFPDRFVALVERCGVSPANVILEITESGLIRELTTALDILTRLRMKGVQLSIDDFGTGYSMMQQLRRVPATELKIDKSFVQTMLSDHRSRIMVQKSIEIGHAVGMQVVAEGVETAEQLKLLHANGCNIAQGNLFSRALPPSELMGWLAGPRARNDRQSACVSSATVT
jgi:EAL domain-containing protein (putative c-di-GMP-specific phosphodiesterase class I)